MSQLMLCPYYSYHIDTENGETTSIEYCHRNGTKETLYFYCKRCAVFKQLRAHKRQMERKRQKEDDEWFGFIDMSWLLD